MLAGGGLAAWFLFMRPRPAMTVIPAMSTPQGGTAPRAVPLGLQQTIPTTSPRFSSSAPSGTLAQIAAAFDPKSGAFGSLTTTLIDGIGNGLGSLFGSSTDAAE
jgi:hypothetical protein